MKLVKDITRRIRKKKEPPVWRDIMKKRVRVERIKDKPCPDCGKLIQRKSMRCSPCSSRINGRKMKKHTGDLSRFTSLGFKGKKHTEEVKRKSRENNNYWKNKKHTDESKLKMRKAAVKRLNRQGMIPSYNESSISIIEEYGKEHGYNFQHAKNGGEVEVLGYFLDGYDKEKNVVIEYMEKHHSRPTKAKKDKIRKQIIVNHLNCKWIEIWE